MVDLCTFITFLFCHFLTEDLFNVSKYPMTHGLKKLAINQRLITRQGHSWEDLLLSNCDKMLPGRHQFRDNDGISEMVF